MKSHSIFLFLFLLAAPLLFSQVNSARFYTLSMKDGLSSNAVTAIFKDSKGFMWFGTEEGLNRYDGFRFTVYRNDPANPKSISGNKISAIVEDQQGGLWIGSDGGLVKYDPETESFRSFELPSPTKNIEKRISELYVDSKGRLWVARRGSLMLLDPKTEKTIAISENKQLNEFVGNKTIVCFFEDSNKNLWLAAWDEGLIKLDGGRKSCTVFKHLPGNPNSLPENSIFSLYEDKYKRLWLGTFSAGLVLFDPAKQLFTTVKHPLIEKSLYKITTDAKNQLWICQGHSVALIRNLDPNQIRQYRNDPIDPKSFTSDCATVLFKDNTGILWFGTINSGVCYHDPNGEKFALIPFGDGVDKGSSNCFVNAFGFEDDHDVLIATYGHGLLSYNPATKKIKRFSAASAGLSSDDVRTVCKLKSGLYWIGTLDGITVFDPKSQQITGLLKHIEGDGNSLLSNSVLSILCDSRGDSWVATEGGLDLVQKGYFTHFTQHGLSDYRINDLVEDKSGNIWVATAFGLHKYDWRAKRFTRYFNHPKNRNSLSSSEILSLLVDSKGTLWVGTRQGLNYYKPETKTFEHYLKNKELEEKAVFRMIEDSKQQLWLNGSGVLYKLDTKTGLVRTYDERDGLSVNANSLAKDKQGAVFVGGKHKGFYTFDPIQIKNNHRLPRIVITGLMVFNKRVPVEPDNKDAILRKSISTTQKITLDYDQSMLEFELGVLNYSLPDKNRLAYQLEGVDKDWVVLGAGKSSVVFTHLQPGSYTLKVKGSNNDGFWNEEGVALEIEILPPFWRTLWAYLFYFLVFFASIALFRYRLMNRLREKSNAVVDQMKLRFFANVSHELRTPLTLISGPLHQLIEEAKDGKVSSKEALVRYEMMQRNTDRLLLLTNQLLDLQKSETGLLKLNLFYGDVIPFLKGVFTAFIPLSEQKNLQYRFSTDLELLETDFDSDKLEKIITNLLSNAFKFTRTMVLLNVRAENESYIIAVEDDGAGIANDQLTKIFDNFYQVDNTTTRNNEGSGIGLALTRELVLLHKGTITAESEVGKGTKMTVELPVSGQRSMVNGQWTADEGQQLLVDAELPTSNYQLPTTDCPLVLIVEDNADLRQYIRNVLGDAYQIAEAENGRVGVEQALELLPDLIISDVMMPEMDGMELCHRLKNDELTSHIPIILLTALSATESKLKGLKTGADDYVSKPFHAELLLARIANLILMRRQLQLKYQQAIQLEPHEVCTNLGDEKFLKRATDLVELHLDEFDFGVEQLAEGLHVSRRGLLRKVKAITGLTMTDFVNSIRLRRVVALLLTNEFTVSEISYKVGFQNRSQLNRSFKEQFKMTPTEFVQSHLREK